MMLQRHRRKRTLAALALVAGLTLAGRQMVPDASAQQYFPDRGSAEWEEIVGALRPLVEAELRQEVVLAVQSVAVNGTWAFVLAEFDGEDAPVDWSKTDYPGGTDESDCGGLASGLLERTSREGWQLVAYDVCSTDFAWLNWPARFGAPDSLFSLDHLAD